VPNPSDVPYVKGPFHADYGLRLNIGSTTFINRHCIILDTPVADVIIGEHCLIGPRCTIVSVEHPLGESDRAAWSAGREVRIGDKVWIGAGVTVL
jgi:acetyltransferase-like isoleucine patch superfamily enzyme